MVKSPCCELVRGEVTRPRTSVLAHCNRANSVFPYTSVSVLGRTSTTTLIHVARLRTCHHTSRSRPYPRTYSQPTTTPRPHGASNLYIRPFHQNAHSPSTCSRGVTPAIFQSCTPSHSANVSVLNFSVLKDGHTSRAHLVSTTMLRSTAARIASHLRCVCDACRS